MRNTIGLVIMGKKKNKIRRNLRMNKLRKTLRKGARRIFCGRFVLVTNKQKINNTSPSSSRLLKRSKKKNKIRREIKMSNIINKAERISGVGSQENKTKRDAKMMNNMTQVFMKRMRKDQWDWKKFGF